MLFAVPSTSSLGETISYDYTLTVHSLKVFDDHDGIGSGEIFLKIIVDDQEKKKLPENDYYEMDDNQIKTIDRLWKYSSNTQNFVFEIEVRENDGASLDDSLGWITIPHHNQTMMTEVTSSPSDAEITLSLEIIRNIVSTSENSVEDLIIMIIIIAIPVAILVYIVKVITDNSTSNQRRMQF